MSRPVSSHSVTVRSPSSGSATSLENEAALEKDAATMKDTGVQVSLAEVPRRKPVPAPTSDETDLEKGTSRSVGVGVGSWWSNKLAALPTTTALASKLRSNGDKKKKRKLIIIIAVVAMLVLALVIGLAAGLTIRNNAAQNLPLPTINGGPYSGDLTYYDPGLGACGITSYSSEPICAVSYTLYDAASVGSDPNKNPLCGLKIRLRRGNKSVDVRIVDRCVGCKATDIDVSTSVFEQLAPVGDGRVDVQWSWLQKPPVSPW